jgi:hypothetical protein
VSGSRGCGGIDGLGGGGGDHLARGPILPVTSRSGLRWHSDGHDIAPDISVGDGLARVAVAWGVPVASSGWSLGNSDSDRAGSRAVGRLRSWHWCGSDWGGSGIGVDGSDNWVARGGGPDAGRQVGGVVCCTVGSSNGSRARDERCLGDVGRRGVGGVVGLGDGVGGSAGMGWSRGHIVALSRCSRLGPVTPSCGRAGERLGG